MSASLVHSRRKRWQGEARQINGKDLPVWAMSEESDYEDYEANTVKKTRRVGRDSEADPNVKMAKIYGSRQRRDDNFPGYSFREHSKPVERRGPPGGDLPGDSLRESLVDPAPTNRPEPPGRTAQSDADTTFYITGNDNVPESTRAYSSRVSTSTTLSTYTSTYTSSKSAEETGSSDSDSDGEGEGTTTSSSLVPTAPAAASSALPSGHNVMVESSHSDVHKALLAVGCVVGLVLTISVLLIIWKLRQRKYHQKTVPLDDLNFQKPSQIDRILAKVPFIRTHLTNRQEWYTIPEPSSNVTTEKPRATPSPGLATRRVDSYMAGGLPIGLGLYGADFSQSVSTIDTSFVPTGKPAGLDNKPKMSSRLKGTPEIATSVLDSPSSKSSTVKESAKPTPEEPTSPIPSARPRTLPSRSRATSFAISPVSTMFVEDTAVQIQVLSRQAPKPIRLSGGKTQPEDVPPLPTPKWNFGLIKRQTGASDLSSISSGFGDGDIIITPNNTVATVNTAKLPVPPSPVANPSGDLSKSYRNRDSARDTQISIDPRPRFHSVSSWVKQQSGQVRQAQQQSGNTPPVPMLPPPEQELRYMMPDGEEPRRPEGV